MVYFTKYAEMKFEILNRHRVFYTKELVEETILGPDKAGRKNGFLTAEKEGLKVIYKEDNGCKRVITFFPVNE
jgi:hypothetical protein